LDEAEFKARFWKPLGTNYQAALEIFRCQGYSKPFIEMLFRFETSHDELAKILSSLIEIRKNTCVMMGQPNVVAELHRLAAYSGAVAKKQGQKTLSKADRKNLRRKKEMERELEFELQNSKQPFSADPLA